MGKKLGKGEEIKRHTCGGEPTELGVAVSQREQYRVRFRLRGASGRKRRCSCRLCCSCRRRRTRLGRSQLDSALVKLECSILRYPANRKRLNLGHVGKKGGAAYGKKMGGWSGGITLKHPANRKRLNLGHMGEKGGAAYGEKRGGWEWGNYPQASRDESQQAAPILLPPPNHRNESPD